MYRQARTTALTEKNIKSAFHTIDLILQNSSYILEQLSNPTSLSLSYELPSTDSLHWTSETPRNLEQLIKQSQLVHASLDRASQSPTEPIAKVIKGCELALVGAALVEQENKEL